MQEPKENMLREVFQSDLAERGIYKRYIYFNTVKHFGNYWTTTGVWPSLTVSPIYTLYDDVATTSWASEYSDFTGFRWEYHDWDDSYDNWNGVYAWKKRMFTRGGVDDFIEGSQHGIFVTSSKAWAGTTPGSSSNYYLAKLRVTGPFRGTAAYITDTTFDPTPSPFTVTAGFDSHSYFELYGPTDTMDFYVGPPATSPGSPSDQNRHNHLFIFPWWIVGESASPIALSLW